MECFSSWFSLINNILFAAIFLSLCMMIGFMNFINFFYDLLTLVMFFFISSVESKLTL